MFWQGGAIAKGKMRTRNPKLARKTEEGPTGRPAGRPPHLPVLEVLHAGEVAGHVEGKPPRTLLSGRVLISGGLAGTAGKRRVGGQRKGRRSATVGSSVNLSAENRSRSPELARVYRIVEHRREPALRQYILVHASTSAFCRWLQHQHHYAKSTGHRIKLRRFFTSTSERSKLAPYENACEEERGTC